MAVLLDSGIVYACYDADDAWHQRALSLFEEEGPFLLPAPVIPEVDHLLGRRLGRAARRAFYDGIVDSAYLVVDLPASAYARVAEIDRTWADLDLGFVDAAIVALAEGQGVSRIATTDRRDFGPLAGALGLTLLPLGTSLGAGSVPAPVA